MPKDEDSAFYPPVAYTADNGSTFAIAGGALYITRDDGATWVRRDYPGRRRSQARPCTSLTSTRFTSGSQTGA